MSPRRRPAQIWRALLHFSVGFVGVGLGTAAAVRYRALLSDWAFDLAFFHNLIASAARGDGFSQSASVHEIDGLVNLSHAFFALPAMVPIYTVLPGLERLLAAQALLLAAGAYGVARLARAGGARESVAFGAAALYLASFPLWRLGLADLRPLMWCVPLLLWLAAALFERRTVEASIAAFLACLCREEAPILVASLAGGMWLFRRTDRRSAMWTINLGLAYFIALLYLRPRMSFYIPFQDPSLIADSIKLAIPPDVPLSRPAEFLARYLPPGAFLALIEPWFLIAAIPLVAYQFFLSPYEWWQWSGSYVHHSAPLLAFTFAAGALAWGRLDRWLTSSSPFAPRPLSRWVVPALMFIALGAEMLVTHSEVKAAMGLSDGDRAQEERADRNLALREIIADIPPTARVATDYLLIARLSGRRHLYCYQSNFDHEGVDGSSGRPIPGLDDVDVMLVDVTHTQWIERLEAADDWRLMKTGGGHHLYNREGAAR